MSENIPPIKGSPYVPRTVNRKAKSAANPVEEVALPRKDQVEISSGSNAKAAGKGEELVSANDMTRYLAMLDEMPDVREKDLDRVMDRLQSGSYGEDALKGTIDGLMDELGL
jgi:hypothetical protein